MSRKVLQIHPKDNVLVALQDLSEGVIISHEDNAYQLLEAIPAKHKFFTKNLLEGDSIIMYGVLVGKAVKSISVGERMTVDNTKHAAEPYRYRGYVAEWKMPDVSKFADKYFNGYHRSNGDVGTANYWLFIPTVFCENRNLDIIKDAFYDALGYAVSDKYKHFVNELVNAYHTNQDFSITDFTAFSGNNKERVFKNIDSIKFLNHSGGCGGTRQDAATLSRLLAAYANHPNVAGVTVLSLGCQHLQVEQLVNDIKHWNGSFDKPLLVFEQQQSSSEESLIKEAIQKTFLQLIAINKLERKPAPLSKLTIGVKCGGSDGFSGISANPAVGYAADMLVSLGGKVLLAEFPELCGAEQDLLDRCVKPDSAEKFIKLMEEYDAQAHAVGSGFFMNPSPGNIKDGLITDAIKSTGAAKKGGNSPVVDVLDYAEPATKAGLSLVCTPGNDVEATTGKAASGATLILFTTGLGTPTGNPVCPVIKLATNNQLAEKMRDIIDINCGKVIDGLKTIEEMGAEILEYCIAAASGEIVPKAVQLNQDDFIPWKRGVSL